MSFLREIEYYFEDRDPYLLPRLKFYGCAVLIGAAAAAITSWWDAISHVLELLRNSIALLFG